MFDDDDFDYYLEWLTENRINAQQHFLSLLLLVIFIKKFFVFFNRHMMDFDLFVVHPSFVFVVRKIETIVLFLYYI